MPIWSTLRGGTGRFLSTLYSWDAVIQAFIASPPPRLFQLSILEMPPEGQKLAFLRDENFQLSILEMLQLVWPSGWVYIFFQLSILEMPEGLAHLLEVVVELVFQLSILEMLRQHDRHVLLDQHLSTLYSWDAEKSKRMWYIKHVPFNSLFLRCGNGFEILEREAWALSTLYSWDAHGSQQYASHHYESFNSLFLRCWYKKAIQDNKNRVFQLSILEMPFIRNRNIWSLWVTFNSLFLRCNILVKGGVERANIFQLSILEMLVYPHQR